MSVFYKFKSSNDCETLQFDDVHISLSEFKKAVIQKKFGKSTNFDLEVTNAETNEVYTEGNALIPKNSSLVVVRVPLSVVQKKWDDQLDAQSDYLQETPDNLVVKTADLASLDAREEDKVQAMMFQSTHEYDPSNFQKVRGRNKVGEPSPSYVCHKCHNPGHWIENCPITVVADVKKSTGIPLSFMTPVEDANVQGALCTPSGKFAVPTIDMKAYKEGKQEKPYIPSEENNESNQLKVPDDLMCSLCNDLLIDAVLTPCCGEKYCDDCIRNALIDSEDNQCPACNEKDTSPKDLVPSRYCRNAANTFRNNTGYSGGGHSIKTTTSDNAKTPEIVNETPEIKTATTDNDVEIVVEESNKSPPKEDVTVETKLEEISPEKSEEKGSAICVLSQRTDLKAPSIRPLFNGTFHNTRPVEPIIEKKFVNMDVKPPPPIDHLEKRRKSSPGTTTPLVPTKLPPPPMNNNYAGAPTSSIISIANTSQLPPGYHQQPLRPPMVPFTNGHPPNVIPQYPPQPMMFPAGRPPYSRPPPMYSGQMPGGYGKPRHHYEESFTMFERHLQLLDREDRNRRRIRPPRRSRSRSPRHSRSRSRNRSPPRSLSKKRSRSPPTGSRDLSPPSKRVSRTPPLRRRSTSRGRVRSRRSRSPISATRSKSRTPIKKKRDCSLSPVPYKKKSPLIRSKSRSRSRSGSIPHVRKRRRTRSRSLSGRPLSRGRSYSRSISPKRRAAYSPGYNYSRGRRYSRSPGRRPTTSSSSRRGGLPPSHYTHSSTYSSSHYDREKRNRYPKHSRTNGSSSSSRYPPSGNNYYDHSAKYDNRYVHNDRFDERRYDSNIEQQQPQQQQQQQPLPIYNDNYVKGTREYYQQPPPLGYNIEPMEHHERAPSYDDVAPPGTTDVIPGMEFDEPQSHSYKDGGSTGASAGGVTTVERRSSQSEQGNERREKSSPKARDEEQHDSDHRRNKQRSSDDRHNTRRSSHDRHSRERNREPQHSIESSSSKSVKSPPSSTDKTRHESVEKKEETSSRDKREKMDKSSKRKKKKEADGERKKKKKTREKGDRKSSGSRKNSVVNTTDDNAPPDDGAIESNKSSNEQNDGGRTKNAIDSEPEKRVSSNHQFVLPEKSKWEREEELSSPTTTTTKTDIKTITTSKDLMKNTLFQTQEATREAKKAGSSIKITVPVTADEKMKIASTAKPSRISAKDRLGAKVNASSISVVKSAVVLTNKPPKSTIKPLLDVKIAMHGELEKRIRESETMKHDDKSKDRFESRHSDHRRVKRRVSKERNGKYSSRKSPSKGRQQTVEEEPPKSSKRSTISEVAIAPAKETTNNKVDEKATTATIDARRPVIVDEANFEPNYDLTESEGETETKADKGEPPADNKTMSGDEKSNDRKKNVAHSESSSGSSSEDTSESSTERKRRKKRKSKKKKKLRRRKTQSSSETESEDESSDSDSSDSRHKQKRRHKHSKSSKKSHKSSKKKRKSKHK